MRREPDLHSRFRRWGWLYFQRLLDVGMRGQERPQSLKQTGVTGALPLEKSVTFRGRLFQRHGKQGRLAITFPCG